MKKVLDSTSSHTLAASLTEVLSKMSYSMLKVLELTAELKLALGALRDADSSMMASAIAMDVNRYGKSPAASAFPEYQAMKLAAKELNLSRELVTIMQRRIANVLYKEEFKRRELKTA